MTTVGRIAPMRTGRPRGARGVTRFRVAAIALVVATAAGCADLRGARLYARGSEALDAGRVDRAIDDLEAAARLVPQRSDVQNHLGLAYARAGRPEAARAAFERAVALDCTNDAAKHNLRVAQERDPEHPPAGP